MGNASYTHAALFSPEVRFAAPDERKITGNFSPLRQETKLGTGWRVGDAPGDFIEAQIQAIVGVELAVEKVEGKWKLSQNRTARDREGVIAGLETVGSERACEMARLMRVE